jgi:hypothetical protein
LKFDHLVKIFNVVPELRTLFRVGNHSVKHMKPCMMMHTGNPSIREAEAGGLQVCKGFASQNHKDPTTGRKFRFEVWLRLLFSFLQIITLVLPPP